LVALVLTSAIVRPYFCLAQNPPTIMKKLSLVRFNNLFETGIVKNVVILLPFGDRIAEEIPNVAIIEPMPNILLFVLLHRYESRGMAHNKYCEHSMCVLGAVVEFGRMKITSGRKIGKY
jgi:hypothetical protein